MKQILTDIKGEVDRNIGIIEDFNTTLTSMDRSSGEKINKETVALNDTLEHMDLIDIFTAFHPKAKEYTFFSRRTNTCPRQTIPKDSRKGKTPKVILWGQHYPNSKTR